MIIPTPASITEVTDIATVEPTPPIAKATVSEPAKWLTGLSPKQKAQFRWVAPSTLKLHPACDFLLNLERSYWTVYQSVEKSGILYPLAVATDGRVLDGRYRLRAAIALSIPEVPILAIEVTGNDAVDWVFQMKDGREFLDEKERAVMAVQYQTRLSGSYVKARATKMMAGRMGTPVKSGKKNSKKLDSRAEACKKFKSPVRQFNAMKKVLTERSDLWMEVISGKLDPAEALKRKGKNVDNARIVEAKAKLPTTMPGENGQLINNIHCGDAVELMKTVPDGTASLVMYSPPYHGVSIAYDPPLPEQTFVEYMDYQRKLLVEAYRTTRIGGRLAIVLDTVKNRDSTTKHQMLPVVAAMTMLAIECGWLFTNDIAWCKDEISGSKTNFGSLATCAAPGFARNHETILVFFKERPRLDGDLTLSDLSRDEHLAWWKSTWHIKPEVNKQRRLYHPAPFPEEIPTRLIKMLTYRGDCVIDPYNGSGTTTSVAAQLGRRFIGIDRSPQYCSLASERTTIFHRPALQQKIEPPKF